VRMPMVLNTEKLAIQAAAYVAAGNGAEKPRVVRIRNSSHVDEIWISEAMLEEARENPDIEIIGRPAPFDFDPEGNLRRE